MTWTDFVKRAITVPYEDRGRDYSGWDCWGLVVCGYRDVLGLKVPDYLDKEYHGRQYRQLAKLFEEGSCDSHWAKAGKQLGAITVLLNRSLPIHAGLLLMHDTVLHCEEGIGTILEPLSEVKVSAYYVATS